jgi:hypothetical protein
VGQPALAYMLRQLGPGTVKDGDPIRLTVQLPPDKVTPDLKVRAEQALRRFCAARIGDNEAHRARCVERFAAASAIIALGICLVLSAVFEQYLYLSCRTPSTSC